MPRLLALLLGSFLVVPFSFAQGRIAGTITDAETGEPLIGANVVLTGTTTGSATDTEGRFEIGNVDAGTYQVTASMLGFESVTSAEVAVRNGATTTVELAMAPRAVSLREVVVTPGRFSVMQARPTVENTMSREDIQGVPQLGEDVFRAVTRLPGLSGNDFSSSFNVRGGANNEVLVMLDGLELYEPFHLKDIGGGGLSILDVEAIGGIDMMTGAFPVEYGDRLSGVFNITSHTPPPGETRFSTGISLTNFRALGSGTFAEDKGAWLVLGRRGYLDIILTLLDEDDAFRPTYYDLFAKTSYRFNTKHRLGIQFIGSRDDTDLTEDDGDDIRTAYGNTYLWSTWNAVWSPRLLSQTVVSIGVVDHSRDGTDFSSRTGELLWQVDDTRRFTSVGLRQDWTFDASDNLLLKAGFDLKQLDAEYDYFVTEETGRNDAGTLDYATNRFTLQPDGTELALYIGARTRLLPDLTVDAGLRYDHASWAGDDLVSPRINAAYQLAKQTALRMGWGYFYQSHPIEGLHVEDGEVAFSGAELAEHRVIGIEHQFEQNLSVRVEAYQKPLRNMQPRFDNFNSDPTDFFPEIGGSRFAYTPDSGEARGLEFLIQGQHGALDWSGSYTLSRVEETFAGITGRRSFDQTHAIYTDFSYRPSGKWRLHVSWMYHTGWPYTPINFSVRDDGSVFGQYAEPRSARYPPYHKLDLRASRYFDIGRSRMTVFLEVVNLYNRTNPRVYFYNIEGDGRGGIRVMRGQDDWLPRLPSIGISWDFVAR
ncbi:MAG: TonB-dependent receptor [Rhodothermales bacterium]